MDNFEQEIREKVRLAYTETRHKSFSDYTLAEVAAIQWLEIRSPAVAAYLLALLEEARRLQ